MRLKIGGDEGFELVGGALGGGGGVPGCVMPGSPSPGSLGKEFGTPGIGGSADGITHGFLKPGFVGVVVGADVGVAVGATTGGVVVGD